MTLPTTGAISLSAIQTEFGGSNPIDINEYYRSGGLVPNNPPNYVVPTGGQIDFGQFHGTSNGALYNGLIGWWEFEDGLTANGSIYTDSTTLNNFTLNNPPASPPASVVTGKIGNTIYTGGAAGSLTGSLSTGTIANWVDTGTAGFTFGGWFKNTSSTLVDQVLISFASGPVIQTYSTGEIAITINSGMGTITSGNLDLATGGLNVWKMLAFTIASGSPLSFNVYYSSKTSPTGSLSNFVASTGINSRIISAPTALRVLSKSVIFDQMFMYSRILTLTELNSLANSNNGRTYSSL